MRARVGAPEASSADHRPSSNPSDVNAAHPADVKHLSRRTRERALQRLGNRTRNSHGVLLEYGTKTTTRRCAISREAVSYFLPRLPTQDTKKGEEKDENHRSRKIRITNFFEALPSFSTSTSSRGIMYIPAHEVPLPSFRGRGDEPRPPLLHEIRDRPRRRCLRRRRHRSLIACPRPGVSGGRRRRDARAGIANQCPHGRLRPQSGDFFDGR